MKKKIEEKLEGIYMMQRKNEKTGDVKHSFVFTGDNNEQADDVSVNALINYFEHLEKQKELALQVMKDKIHKRDVIPEEGKNV
jgi:hypothetical protein